MTDKNKNNLHNITHLLLTLLLAMSGFIGVTMHNKLDQVFDVAAIVCEDVIEPYEQANQNIGDTNAS